MYPFRQGPSGRAIDHSTIQAFDHLTLHGHLKNLASFVALV